MSLPILKKNGIREIDFTIDDEGTDYLKRSWKNYIKSLAPYPESKYNGRGIVMCAGGIKYFTCAWIAIKQLRAIGCKLIVELWFLGDELSEEVVNQLETLNVVCKNFRDHLTTELDGVMLKPLAIVHSQFKDVLFLDADNNCVKDPSYLFDTKEYLQNGAVFWPDYWKTAPDNPIWQIVDSQNYNTNEQESGQLVINKHLCWKEINLCLFFNENHAIYHKLLLGDKDTFKFAWIALKSKFFMIKKEVAICGFVKSGRFFGTTMVQHSPTGDILFLHRNLLKWDVTKLDEYVWEKIKEFKHDAILKEYNSQRFLMDISGEILFYDAPVAVRNMEKYCLAILKQLRESDFYARFLTYIYIMEQRSIRFN